MESAVWRGLIALVPQKQHNKLGVMTKIGVEIAVQDLVRVQEDYLVIRGRLSGTSDPGRLFFVPYDQITYIGILKLVMENEVAEIFGTPTVSPATAKALTASPAPESSPEQTPAEPVSQPESDSLPHEELDEEKTEEHAPRTPTPVKFPNRAELLERIKNRSHGGTGPRPPLK